MPPLATALCPLAERLAAAAPEASCVEPIAPLAMLPACTALAASCALPMLPAVICEPLMKPLRLAVLTLVNPAPLPVNAPVKTFATLVMMATPAKLFEPTRY